MPKNRLEAFSDGVIAIIITIMVLELKVPEGHDLPALLHVLPRFCSYVLSFVYIGIYWNNHHHLLHTCERVSGGILWANLHLLFWLSLVPFATEWIGESHSAPLPTALYGALLFMAAVSYTVLQVAIIRRHGRDSQLQAAVGRDFKGKISMLLYVVAIAVAFYVPVVAEAIYATVALIWLIPDTRIESKLT